MVLFLFIIMLLDLKAEKLRKTNFIAFAGGGVISLAFVVGALVRPSEIWISERLPFPPLSQKNVDDVHNVGKCRSSRRTIFHSKSLAH